MDTSTILALIAIICGICAMAWSIYYERRAQEPQRIPNDEQPPNLPPGYVLARDPWMNRTQLYRQDADGTMIRVPDDPGHIERRRFNTMYTMSTIRYGQNERMARRPDTGERRRKTDDPPGVASLLLRDRIATDQAKGEPIEHSPAPDPTRGGNF